MLELTTSFSFVIGGLVCDVVGASLIVIPLWNVGKRTEEYLKPKINFWIAESLKGLWSRDDPLFWNTPINELDERNKKNSLKRAEELKHEIKSKNVEQWLARIGIIVLIFGFLLQTIGIILQWQLANSPTT